MRKGLSTSIEVAVFAVFIVLLATILILANTGVLPGIGEGFQNVLDTVIERPVSLLEGLFS